MVVPRIVSMTWARTGVETGDGMNNGADRPGHALRSSLLAGCAASVLVLVPAVAVADEGPVATAQLSSPAAVVRPSTVSAHQLVVPGAFHVRTTEAATAVSAAQASSEYKTGPWILVLTAVSTVIGMVLPRYIRGFFRAYRAFTRPPAKRSKSDQP
jgi:hypothetical protein